MRFSRLLRTKLVLLQGEYGRAHRRFWDHPRFPELIPPLFVQTHQLIRASVPLMEAARARAVELSASDPAAAALDAYLGQHIREERDHDEWLLADLELLGLPRDEVLERIPPPRVAEAVGAQYYWLRHDHPVALLGYVAVLEGYPPTEEMVDEMVARSGLPRDAFRTFRKHAHLDPRHRDDLDRALDEMPLTPRQQSLIGVSALTTMRQLAGLLDGLVDEVEGAVASRPAEQVASDVR